MSLLRFRIHFSATKLSRFLNVIEQLSGILIASRVSAREDF